MIVFTKSKQKEVLLDRPDLSAKSSLSVDSGDRVESPENEDDASEGGSPTKRQKRNASPAATTPGRRGRSAAGVLTTNCCLQHFNKFFAFFTIDLTEDKLTKYEARKRFFKAILIYHASFSDF